MRSIYAFPLIDDSTKIEALISLRSRQRDECLVPRIDWGFRNSSIVYILKININGFIFYQPALTVSEQLNLLMWTCIYKYILGTIILIITIRLQLSFSLLAKWLYRFRRNWCCQLRMRKLFTSYFHHQCVHVRIGVSLMGWLFMFSLIVNKRKRFPLW